MNEIDKLNENLEMLVAARVYEIAAANGGVNSSNVRKIVADLHRIRTLLPNPTGLGKVTETP